MFIWLKVFKVLEMFKIFEIFKIFKVFKMSNIYLILYNKNNYYYFNVEYVFKDRFNVGIKYADIKYVLHHILQ